MAKRPAKAPAAADALPDDFSYESHASRLDAIVQRLESGQLPLAESLRLFDEGQVLLRQCQQWLDRARLRVSEATDAGERPLDAND